jgi:hypothetical protein
MIFRRRVRWDRTFVEYATDPHAAWDHPRQADKLHRSITEGAGHFGEGVGAYIERVVAMAHRREDPGRRPVFVVGMGGSGSHWLSGLIAGLPGFAVTKEVYFPKKLLKRLDAMDPEDAARTVDAVHLAHALAIDPEIDDAMLVNNARGKPASYRAWLPQSTIVYLVRDPRDQVLSVTFRKPGFRALQAPDASDREYLEANARANVARFRSMERAAGSIDLRVRYEDLQEDPRPALAAFAERHGVTVSAEEVSAAVRDHAPRRSGGGDGVDPGLWALLGALLEEPLVGLGYAAKEELVD